MKKYERDLFNTNRRFRAASIQLDQIILINFLTLASMLFSSFGVFHFEYVLALYSDVER